MSRNQYREQVRSDSETESEQDNQEPDIPEQIESGPPLQRSVKRVKMPSSMDWEHTVFAVKGILLLATSLVTIIVGFVKVGDGTVSSRDPWFIASQILAISAPAGWLIDRFAALTYELGHKQAKSTNSSVARRAVKHTKKVARWCGSCCLEKKRGNKTTKNTKRERELYS